MAKEESLGDSESAELDGVDLSPIVLDGKRIVAELHGTRLGGASISSSNFESVRLDHACLDGAQHRAENIVSAF
ncbi:MAG: pentapeptide repeat-containing protein [Planctomycetaceae bacterium]